MSDRPQSIPVLEEAAPFREAFLAAFFGEPQHLLAIRHFGSLFYDLAAEWSRYQAPPGAWTVAMLRAFAVDVGYSAQLLRGTLAEGTGSPWERAAAVEAERWSTRLAAIAADMEAFLSPPELPS